MITCKTALYTHNAIGWAKNPSCIVLLQNTVQEYLLARVIFGEFVYEKQLADFILAI